MRLVALLFLLFPILELLFLIRVGGAIGAIPAVALVLFGSAMGVLVLRQVGWRTAWLVDQRMRRGEPPTVELLDGFAMALGGLLLLLPGLLSDLLGLLCLLPPLRRGLARRLLGGRTMPPPGPGPGGPAGPSRPPDVIEGEFRREQD